MQSCTKCTIFFALVLAVLLPALVRDPTYPVQDGVVLITGASTGIGLAAALHLAELHSSSVILCGVRKRDDFERLAGLGVPNVRPIYLDVASTQSIRAALVTVEGVLQARSLPLVGLVNNAGVAAGPTAVEFHALEDARALFAVNLFGALETTQAFLPLLRAARGRLVAVSSVFGSVAPPMGGVYSASKFALEALHDSLRRELKGAGVSVSVVAPGAVTTPIFRTLEPASLKAARHRGDPATAVYPQFYTNKDLDNELNIEALADSPSVTSAAIEHALFSPQPQTRYFVANILGAPAWLLAGLAHLLPTRLMDTVMLQKG
jgi:NAD(P)-dependent dehydrogenase (short-subunit alcohol dehydrogenase family)